MNELLTDNQLIASLLLLLSLYLVRFVLVKQLQGSQPDSELLPKRWLNTINNIATLIAVLGLGIIWLSELRFVALSVAAFAVALVIATREYIQCILGSLYLTLMRLFHVGDWIQLGTHCGEVTRSDWLTTQLREVDIASKSYQYTGATLTLPNSFLVTQVLVNHNHVRQMISHEFSIVREAADIDLLPLRDFIASSAEAICRVCVPIDHIGHQEENLSEVRFETTNLGKHQFRISIRVPSAEIMHVEQQLTFAVMAEWRKICAEHEQKDTLSHSEDDHKEDENQA